MAEMLENIRILPPPEEDTQLINWDVLLQEESHTDLSCIYWTKEVLRKKIISLWTHPSKILIMQSVDKGFNLDWGTNVVQIRKQKPKRKLSLQAREKASRAAKRLKRREALSDEFYSEFYGE